MKDEIAQITALVGYGNAFLQGKSVSFDKNHPAGFHYFNIRFVEKLPEDLLARKTILADDPNLWFKYLKDKNVSRLYLSFQPSTDLGLEDHISSAFVGGGSQWTIIAEKGDKCEITLTIVLPHGYPNNAPKIHASPIINNTPHRWQDGALCVFGVMNNWNPGRHNITFTLALARKWLFNYREWCEKGSWPKNSKRKNEQR